MKSGNENAPTTTNTFTKDQEDHVSAEALEAAEVVNLSLYCL